MDMFALHPYAIPSKLRPDFAHPNSTTIGLADYPKLVALLTTAFARTAQAGATLPIIYDEFGYQTRVPMLKRSLYTHLGTPAAQDAITEPRQALYYQQAIAIARCQPTVAGMLIFHVTDERDANAWQSGVYYPDDTPKTSMDALRAGAIAAQDGTGVECDEAEDGEQLRERRLPPAADRAGAAADRPDVRVGVHLSRAADRPARRHGRRDRRRCGNRPAGDLDPGRQPPDRRLPVQGADTRHRQAGHGGRPLEPSVHDHRAATSRRRR